jgi:hypothetical protein
MFMTSQLLSPNGGFVLSQQKRLLVESISAENISSNQDVPKQAIETVCK